MIQSRDPNTLSPPSNWPDFTVSRENHNPLRSICRGEKARPNDGLESNQKPHRSPDKTIVTLNKWVTNDDETVTGTPVCQCQRVYMGYCFSVNFFALILKEKYL